MARWVNRPEGSNWGEFGVDDQRGRMNLVTPERRLAGVREVVDGVSFCLSLPLDYPGGNGLVPYREEPQLFAQILPDGRPHYNHAGEPGGFAGCCDVSSDDRVILSLQYSTQWDALCHWGRKFDADGDGVDEIVYYNGWRAHEHVRGPDDPGGPGAAKLGIENLAEAGPQGRAAVVNLHRIYGDEPVGVGYDELMRAFDAQKVTVEQGDFLIVYSGLDVRILAGRKTPDVEMMLSGGPRLDGSDPALLKWVTDSGVVALCSDTPAVEKVNRVGEILGTGTRLPLHTHCLFKLGVHLGELWYLKELADHLWERGRSACLLTAPPLRLPGAVGSPVAGVALV